MRLTAPGKNVAEKRVSPAASPRDMPGVLKTLAELGGIGFMRAAPGMVNLVAIVLLSRGIAAPEYGIYSTIVATGGFVAAITFGFLYSATVAQYSSNGSRGEGGAYLGTILTAGAACAILCGVIALIAVPVSAVVSAAALTVAAIGGHTLLQELVRARLRFWLYGASDLAQATGFLVAVAVVQPDAASTAAILFAGSYLPACLINGVALTRHVRLSVTFEQLRALVGPAGWMVAGTVTENILFLGARYALLAAGAGRTLGEFSLAVDLAQRTVGFVVNATSFLYQPKAFHEGGKNGADGFHATIRRGVRLAMLLAAGALAFCLGFAAWLPTRALLPQEFVPLTFALVALAVVINRLKKLALDSLALHRRATFLVPVSNLIGSVAGLLAIGLFAWWGLYWAVAAAYLAGYTAIAASLFMLLRCTRTARCGRVAP